MFTHGLSVSRYQIREKVRYMRGLSESLRFGPPRCITRVSYTTSEPAAQWAVASVMGRTRLALSCVPSWNSVGPFASVKLHKGTKIVSECGGLHMRR